MRHSAYQYLMHMPSVAMLSFAKKYVILSYDESIAEAFWHVIGTLNIHGMQS
jgi:hypothetical protein